MGDFPLQDILFIIKVIKEKSYLVNLAGLVKSVTNIINYGAKFLHFNPPTPNPIPIPTPGPVNPPITMAVSDDMLCEALQDCADHPEGGISLTLIAWLTQWLLGLL